MSISQNYYIIKAKRLVLSMKKILGILILFFTFNLSFSFADNDQIFSKVNSYDNISEKIGNYTFEYTISFFRIYDKSGK